jgi:hypothetical protein
VLPARRLALLRNLALFLARRLRKANLEITAAHADRAFSVDSRNWPQKDAEFVKNDGLLLHLL